MFYIFSSLAGMENTFGQSLCFLKLNSAVLPIEMNSFQKEGTEKSSSKYRLQFICHADGVFPHYGAAFSVPVCFALSLCTSSPFLQPSSDNLEIRVRQAAKPPV